jgi:hypothetical protein
MSSLLYITSDGFIQMVLFADRLVADTYYKTDLPTNNSSHYDNCLFSSATG